METSEEFKARVRELRSIISDEMSDHLFLWVPAHRAQYFSRDAETFVGAECCNRFPSVRKEVEEAAKFYATGRYTASAFHMTRATEAGIQAVARAIQFIPKDNNWTLVFREMGTQFKVVSTNPQTTWPAHWQTHKDFLETVWADLRAVSKAWRSDIAHLVDSYSEDEAKGLLDVISLFLKHLATKMDETGTLY